MRRKKEKLKRKKAGLKKVSFWVKPKGKKKKFKVTFYARR